MASAIACQSPVTATFTLARLIVKLVIGSHFLRAPSPVAKANVSVIALSSSFHFMVARVAPHLTKPNLATRMNVHQTAWYHPCETIVLMLLLQMSGWSEWSACNAQCGGGVMNRTRTVERPPANGGAACPPLVDIKECNLQLCSPDVVLSNWSGMITISGVVLISFAAWTPCDATCGPGFQYRHRTVVSGVFRPNSSHKLEEVRTCDNKPCPVHCVVSDWPQSWGPCSKSCGYVTTELDFCSYTLCLVSGGMSVRQRHVLVPAQFGGKRCPSLTEQVPCNTLPCATNCAMTDWSPWSACRSPNNCGSGFAIRTRTVSQPATFGGRTCGPVTQTRACDNGSCPASKTRLMEVKDPKAAVRVVDQGHSYVTDPVSGVILLALTDSANQLVVTNKSEIAVVLDCVVSDWSPLSECTASCGTKGLRERYRKVIQPAQSGGRPCPPLRQTVPCDGIPCPVDCVVGNWTAWTPCSTSVNNMTCGGGIRHRSRPIITPPQHGGRECPAILQAIECDMKPCPIDCQVPNCFTCFGGH